MAICHIVLVQWKAETSEAEALETMTALCGLADVIAELESAEAGELLTPDEFTHALVFRVATRDALRTYSAHPAHQRVVTEQLRPLAAAIRALDVDLFAPGAVA